MLLQVQGKQIYIYTAGKAFAPTLPTVVFLHGAQNEHSVWSLQSRYFAYHGYNVLALDLPGHGRSEGPALGSVEAMSAWLVSVLDALGVAKVSLVGHSMGSLIALDFARIAADRLDKVALLGNAYPMKVADALLTMARDDEPMAIDMVTSWSHWRSTQSTKVPGANLQGAARRLMQQMSELNPDQLFFTDFSACNNYQQGEAGAAALVAHNIAVTFVLARQDRMTPLKASAKLRASLPHAVTVDMDSCGHSMMAEQPDLVLAALKRAIA